MDASDYEAFLDELTATLEADPNVLGLVALGSTADASYRDRWSDYDFWVITSPGAQSRYLDTFSWLPRAGDILMTVRHGSTGRAVLYADGHKAEYAVFDPEEAAGGKIERFRVLIDRGDIGGLAESIRLQTREERAAALARPDLLENLCVKLLTAHERWERGELLSARQYIQFSVNTFLDLLIAHGGLNRPHAADEMDARRRLEQTEPELGRELGRVCSLAPAEAGVALIDLAQKRLAARAPELAWDKVSVVRKWLQDAAGNV
ncbi:MAG TPA: hypothetical protein VJ866_24635 [Pyrinomonadaceae bacterium]|nr:hypothetical protein [Pyrinomonadaceae bacterium]